MPFEEKMKTINTSTKTQAHYQLIPANITLKIDVQFLYYYKMLNVSYLKR
jgi:hypothetical protein